MFVKRKPEPLGAELKNIGCALSGIMLFIEIVRGAAEVRDRFWLLLYGYLNCYGL